MIAERNTVMRNGHGWGLALALGVLLSATGAAAAETPDHQGLGQLECVKLLIEDLGDDELESWVERGPAAQRPAGRDPGKTPPPARLGRVVSQHPVSERDHGHPQGDGGILRRDHGRPSSSGTDCGDHVRSVIDDMTTEFAAAYYRAGNE